MPNDLEIIFPKLQSEGYRQTSPRTNAYNCIAWAAGNKQRWWEPIPGYYWPLPVPQAATVSGLIRAFKTLGYVECDNTNYEAGSEKVIIYGEQGDYTHAARQLDNGKWTSKLGELEDIEHDTPEGLLDSDYGEIVAVMKRSKHAEN